MATLTLGSIKVLEEYVTHSYFGRFVQWFGYRVYKIPLDAMDGEDITPTRPPKSIKAQISAVSSKESAVITEKSILCRS
jgi:hypothetical protein